LQYCTLKGGELTKAQQWPLTITYGSGVMQNLYQLTDFTDVTCNTDLRLDNCWVWIETGCV